EKLTARAGLNIPRERMFLMNASAKTNELNAYVTGFGASKRVVIYDTLLKKLSPQETLFIFGHESGHYVLNHIRNGFLVFRASLFVTLYLVYRLLDWFLARMGTRWRVYGPQDWAALAVLLLLFEAIMFLSSPVVNGFSRIQEHQADIFGLELVHGIVPNSAQVAAHAFQAMREIDLADPNPPPPPPSAFPTLAPVPPPPPGRTAALRALLRPRGKERASQIRRAGAVAQAWGARAFSERRRRAKAAPLLRFPQRAMEHQRRR